MTLFMGNVSGSWGSPHGARGRTCGSVQGLRGGKVRVPVRVRRVCGPCGDGGRFLVGSLTEGYRVGMQRAWQLKPGCSIRVPWQLLDIAQGHDHLPARGQGTQEADKHLSRLLRPFLKVFQIVAAPRSLVQLLGLGGKGRTES